MSLVSLLLAVAVAAAQPADTAGSLPPVVVTASRNPQPLDEAPRSITVIDRSAIEACAASSVTELLELVAGVDMRQRGVEGMQADLSIRGSTFEQTLVMIDGVAFTDVQTGHHNMDLPLLPGDIERIEVLRGQASRLYGPSAIGGVVNIITRRPSASAMGLSASAGSFNLFAVNASAQARLGPLGQRLSLSKSVCDGYRHNTAFGSDAALYQAELKLGRQSGRLLAGYVDKQFGANGFYSDAYPGQWEHTTTMLAMLSSELALRRLSLRPAVQWRRHEDDYLLDALRPSLYRNRTFTDGLGGSLEAGMDWLLGTLSLAGRGNMEVMTSTMLGDHTRYQGGIFAQQAFDLWNRLRLTPGATLYYCTGHHWTLLPGMDLGLSLGGGVNLFGTVDYSCRVPTFTELYTVSPSNLGEPGLRSERSLSFEGGCRYTGRQVSATVDAFMRNASDVIDWVRSPGQARWRAANVDEVRATGAEFEARANFRGPFANSPFVLDMGYAFVDLRREAGDLRRGYAADVGIADSLAPGLDLQYKYGTDYLRHKLSLGIDHALLAALRLNWRLRYERREGSPATDAFLLDLRAHMELKRVGAFAEVTNLLDQHYHGAGTIPMPGRWYRLGLSIGVGQDAAAQKAGSEEERRGFFR